MVFIKLGLGHVKWQKLKIKAFFHFCKLATFSYKSSSHPFMKDEVEVIDFPVHINSSIKSITTFHVISALNT